MKSSLLTGTGGRSLCLHQLCGTKTLMTLIIDGSVKTQQVWSDGPSSQFKNRFIAVATKAYSKDMLELFRNITWERTCRWNWWSIKKNGYTEGDLKQSQKNQHFIIL